jgi:TRAP-type C4-dicarboxylate transport system permease small subunit
MTKSTANKLLFGKQNYILLIASALIIGIGFILMAGGGAELGPDGYAHEFDAEGIYSFRRITLAPIVILIGFVLAVFSILKKPE